MTSDSRTTSYGIASSRHHPCRWNPDFPRTLRNYSTRLTPSEIMFPVTSFSMRMIFVLQRHRRQGFTINLASFVRLIVNTKAG